MSPGVEDPSADVTDEGAPAEDTEAARAPVRRAPDAIEVLLTFHQRLRVASATLRQLARLPAQHVDSESVAALYEFFKEDVAHHDLDEEASLLTRLRRTEHPARLERMLDACTRQHEHLESALEALLPHLQAATLGLIRVDPARLGLAAAELERVLGPHLTLEEQEIFPMARLLLSPNDLAEITREVEDRRRARVAGSPRALALNPSPEPEDRAR